MKFICAILILAALSGCAHSYTVRGGERLVMTVGPSTISTAQVSLSRASLAEMDVIRASVAEMDDATRSITIQGKDNP